jgi:methyl-accepting chemotaxis protein
MKIKTQFFLINLAFFLIVAVMSGIAIFQIYTLNVVFNDSKTISAALRNQVEADMMHDGLRADVLYAIKLVNDQDYSKKDEAIASTAEHADNFNRLIAEVKSANISKAVNDNIEQLQEPLDRYIKSANAITNDVFKSPEQAKKLYGSFEEDFEYLEGAMADFSSVIESEFENINQDVLNKKRIIIALVFVATIISLLVGFWSWYTARLNIIYPLSNITKSMSLIAAGNLDTHIPNTKDENEISDIAQALEVFQKNAVERNVLAEEQKKSQESLYIRSEHIDKSINIFDSAILGIIDAVSFSATKMKITAEKMSSAVSETAQASSLVASAANEADSNVQTVAAASEELAASSAEIARQIADVAKKANSASQEARTTSHSVSELNQLADSIGEVVSAIKDIAEQTNLLALNATIEAARAGDAGKGFAVVADEVKKLATETAKKTEEIDERVVKIQTAIRASVEAMSRIIDNVQTIDGATSSVAGAVQEQNAATSEIGRNVTEASIGTQQVSQNIQTVEAVSRQTGISAHEVLSAADDLSGLSTQLSEQVKSFLHDMRQV